jgi:hypothetical protein
MGMDAFLAGAHANGQETAHQADVIITPGNGAGLLMLSGLLLTGLATVIIARIAEMAL